jgi:hypothetical protein
MSRAHRPALAAVLLLTLLGLGATPAAAQDRLRLGLRLGAFEPSNSQDSYDAVYGDTMTQIGGQLEWHTQGRLFYAVSIDYGTVDGSLRAPPTPPQGIDTELTLMPVHVTAAWFLRPRESSWNVYAGLGPSLLIWEESVDFAGVGLEDTSETDLGASAVLGLRKPFDRFSLSGELRWSTFPSALDEETNPFGDDDLGGLGVAVVGLWKL